MAIRITRGPTIVAVENGSAKRGIGTRDKDNERTHDSRSRERERKEGDRHLLREMGV
jgi:hypothetical protein